MWFTFDMIITHDCAQQNMAGILGAVFYNRLVQRAARRERVFRDHINPLDRYDDTDFKARYRLSRQAVIDVIDMLEDDLATHSNCHTTVSPAIRVLVTLRCYATGSYQRTSGDLHGISASATCNIIHQVSRALA